jgi:hypothetical protein
MGRGILDRMPPAMYPASQGDLNPIDHMRHGTIDVGHFDALGWAAAANV